MSEQVFFKPTNLYKEFKILDLIEKNPNLTQRMINKTLGIAVSMVNNYLDDYENQGLIKRKYHSLKNVEYLITKKGQERKKLLNIGYLNSSQRLYNSAKENIESYLLNLSKIGYKNIILYGAGEVAELLINTIYSSRIESLKVVAIIDDDIQKAGSSLLSYKIISLENISSLVFDAILISTIKNNDIIYNKILSKGFSKDKIIQFFSN